MSMQGMNCKFVLLHAFLRLLLRRQALLLLLRGALHAALGEGLVADKLAVHALHGHLLRAPRALDAIAVVLVDLVVPGVVLGLGHGAGALGEVLRARAPGCPGLKGCGVSATFLP